MNFINQWRGSATFLLIGLILFSFQSFKKSQSKAATSEAIFHLSSIYSLQDSFYTRSFYYSRNFEEIGYKNKKDQMLYSIHFNPECKSEGPKTLHNPSFLEKSNKSDPISNAIPCSTNEDYIIFAIGDLGNSKNDVWAIGHNIEKPVQIQNGTYEISFMSHAIKAGWIICFLLSVFYPLKKFITIVSKKYDSLEENSKVRLFFEYLELYSPFVSMILIMVLTFYFKIQAEKELELLQIEIYKKLQ